jgi:CBS domain-containing protein
MLRDFKYSKMNSFLETMSETRKSLHEFYEMKVKDLMQTLKSKLSCIDEKADVTTVLSILNTTDHVWVMDSTEPTQLLGVVTESDTLVLFSPPLTSLQSFDKPDSRSMQYGEVLLVEEIMSKKPVTVSPDETIRDVLLKMKEQKIKQLAVVDENQRLIGEISLRILIQEFSKQHIDVSDKD